MTTEQPSLFDELRRQPDPLHTYEATWCQNHADTLALWEEHGIPADLSTVEHACSLLFALWRRHRALEATMAEMLGGAVSVTEDPQ